MRFSCSMTLPRELRIVPVARHFCQNAMKEFGVEGACANEIALAITEACANIVKHSSCSAEEFEVHMELDESHCVIRVVDAGQGFDAEARMRAPLPGTESEGGRGIFLMKALVDSISFDSRPDQGTAVRLVKRLKYTPGSAMASLAQAAGQ